MNGSAVARAEAEAADALADIARAARSAMTTLADAHAHRARLGRAGPAAARRIADAALT